MVDFEVYRTAGARATAGESLYRATDEHYQFKYFPAFAFVFAPFAALPVPAAKAVWFALSVGLLAALLVLSLRQLPARVVPASLVAIATILTLGKFYAHELTLGQANLLFGVVAIGGLYDSRMRATSAPARCSAQPSSSSRTAWCFSPTCSPRDGSAPRLPARPSCYWHCRGQRLRTESAEILISWELGGKQ